MKEQLHTKLQKIGIKKIIDKAVEKKAIAHKNSKK
jgi:hypothetical protein